jgi:enolase-phosphatase E1
VGSKKEPASYRRIATQMGVAPERVVFLSDVEAELDAAAEVGMHTWWLVREGPLPGESVHRVVRSFAAIDFD